MCYCVTTSERHLWRICPVIISAVFMRHRLITVANKLSQSCICECMRLLHLPHHSWLNNSTSSFCLFNVLSFMSKLWLTFVILLWAVIQTCPVFKSPITHDRRRSVLSRHYIFSFLVWLWSCVLVHTCARSPTFPTPTHTEGQPSYEMMQLPEQCLCLVLKVRLMTSCGSKPMVRWQGS